MSDAVSATTPPSARMSMPRPWVSPRIAELPKLTALTLASAIGGTGGTGSGGSTVFGLLLAVGLLFGAAACSPERELAGAPSEGSGPAAVQRLTCRGEVATLAVTCATQDGPQGAPGQGIMGKQGVNIGLRSTNVSYNGGTGILSADVTVQNLTGSPIGTLDGTNVSSGVNVFFTDLPVAAPTGSVTVNNPSGTNGTFTGSGQTYYQYNEVIAPAGTSSTMTWEFHFASGATSFTFTVLVAADRQYPGGIQRWSAAPFGGVSWKSVSGWGADGLALFGAKGEVMYREGGVWHNVFDGYTNTNVSPNHAFGISGSSLWSGVYDFNVNSHRIRKWDGAGWQTVDNEPGGPANGDRTLTLVGSTPYVLGNQLWHYTANTWSSDTLPNGSGNLDAGAVIGGKLVVASSSDANVWLFDNHQYFHVGPSGTGQVNGGVFTIFGTDTTHLWVATNGTDDDELRYYDGSSWTTQTLSPTHTAGWAPTGALALSPTNAFITVAAGGGGRVFHWNGTSWATERAGSAGYNAIWARNANEIYVARNDGGVEMRDGLGNWSVVMPGMGNTQISTLAMVSATDGFLSLYSTGVFRYNGATWDSVGAMSGPTVSSIFAPDGSHVWITDRQSELGYYDGTTFSTVPANNSYTGLGGSSATDVWGVGSGIIDHSDGGAFTASSSYCAITCLTLNAVWADSPTFAVAVGQGGKIAMWNGTSWSSAIHPPAFEFLSVHGSSPTNVWAVGYSAAQRWNGTTWTSYAVSGQDLLSVYAVSPSEAYAVGNNGGLIRFNGVEWLPMAPNAYLQSQSLRAVSVKGGVGFIAGQYMLLKGER